MTAPQPAPAPGWGRRIFRLIAVLAVALGLSLFFTGFSSAHTPSVTHITQCAKDNSGWSATFTVHNDPDSRYGSAKISGTGTSLDGNTISAGGDSSPLTIAEPGGVTSVKLSGKLTWSKDHYSAPFSDTAYQPQGCGAPTKVYVCKYVGTPGVDERLKSGKQPIEVSINAIPDYQGPGSYFADAQGRSYVLATVPQSPEPTAADCPSPDTPPTRVTVTVPTTVHDTVTQTVTAPTTVLGTITETAHETATVTQRVTDTVTETAPTTITQEIPTTVYDTMTSTSYVPTTIEVPVTVTRTDTSTVTETQMVPTTVYVPTTILSTETDVETATQMVTETATVLNTVTEQNTVTQNNTAVVTEQQTVQLPGQVTTVTKNQVITLGPVVQTLTVTEDHTFAATVTEHDTVTAQGKDTTVYVPTTVYKCPPGATISGGSLAYTGGGPLQMIAVYGGALVFAGTIMWLASLRKKLSGKHSA